MLRIHQRPLPVTPGVLDPSGTARHLNIRQFTACPAEDLPWLEHVWTVAWDLPDGCTHLQRTLPFPVFNLVCDSTRGTALFGSPSACFDYRLRGRGHVTGFRLRPGAQSAFWRGKAHRLTDASLPAAECLPEAAAEALDALRASLPDAQDIEQALNALNGAAAQLPAAAGDCAAIVAMIAEQPDIFRTETLALRCCLPERSLQRLFRTHIGLPPKLVISRYRMQEALRVLHGSGRADLARLAQDLGYFDQAHFANAFRRLTGEPPGRYLARSPGG